MFILVLLFQCQGQFNIITTIDGVNVSIYENQITNEMFQVQEQYQCHPSKMFEEQFDQDNRIFYFENLHSSAINLSINPFSLKFRDMQLMNVTNQVEQQEIEIQGNQGYAYEINYQCYQNWAYVELHVRYGKLILNFRYIKICEKSLYYHEYPYFILSVISILVVFVASKYGQKRFKLKRQQNNEVIDELESRETYYRARGMFSPQYSQPEQIMNDFQTTMNTNQLKAPEQKETNLKLRIALYLLILCIYLSILYFLNEIQLLEIPLIALYFICVQIAITDLLIFIVSSSVSPYVYIPLFGRIKLINLFTYLLQFVFTFFQITTDHWILNNINSICLLFQLIRFMKFFNLIQILSVYGFIYSMNILSWFYLDIYMPQIQFPNTIFLDNPKLTCANISILELMLPSSLLTFIIYFSKQTRSYQLLFPLSFISFLIGVGFIQYLDIESIISVILNYLIPSILIMMTINIYGIVKGEIKSLYQGIELGQHNRAIQQQFSYELTIDKYNKNYQ